MGIPAANPVTVPRGAQATRVRYWVVVFAVALAVITYVDRVCISFSAPFIRHDLNLSAVQLGWVFTAFGWAYALFEIPAGFMGDRIGVRRVLMRIVLWWSFFTAASGWAWNFASLAVIRFLFGAGEAGCFPNLAKIFTTWLPARERVRAQGCMWLSARWGGAFTPPLVSLVIAEVGWRHSFEIFALMGVVWAVLFGRWYHNDPLRNASLNEAERELLRASSELAVPYAKAPWKKLLLSRQIWLLCWQYFCLSYGWYFYITWLPTYLREGRHLEITSTAALSMLPLFLGGIANPVSVFLGEQLTRWTRDVNVTRRMLACTGYAGACAALIYSTRVNDPRLAMLNIALASFCGDLALPHSWVAAMDLGGHFAGTVGGTMNCWGNVGGAISPLVIGYVLSWTNNNWNVTFYISAVVYVAAIVCWLFLDSTTPVEDQ